MIFYSYDPTTLIFSGEVLAQENPVKKGEFLEPAFSTKDKPPVPGENQIPMFKDGSWTLMPNFAGKMFWDKNGVPGIMREVGVPLPDGATLTQPPLTTAQKQELLKSKAKNALDDSDIVVIRCTEAGVSVPSDWKTYREALRSIVSGKSTATELPSQPAYPSGT